MTTLSEELLAKKLREQAEIEREIAKEHFNDTLQGNLDDFEKELSLWYSWLTMNARNLTAQDVQHVLRRSKQLVSELMEIGKIEGLNED